ncbi:MAG TPA: amidohydrolase family protein, partial [Myxococcaceae bacterium]
ALLPTAGLAATTERMALVTSNGRTGTLSVTTEGRTVDVDWRVDDNGRGSKIREHIVLGANGLPISRAIDGTSTFGAPVKETFTVEGGRARWASIDDKGEARAGDALYVDNRGSPWTYLHFVKVMLGSKRLTRAAFPSGILRLEKLREVTVGPSKERLQAYALWGTSIGSPPLLLVRGRTLVASVSPYSVLTREEHAGRFAELSGIARELNAELLRDLSKRLTHHPDGPVWITHARLFDPVSGTATTGQNVVLYRDRIVGVRPDAPPPGATTIDAEGGTLLPGLIDSHAHTADWDGLLDIASGVTQVRDPGNDNTSLLALMPRFDSGEFVGPRVFPSGFLEGKSPFSASAGFTVRTVEEALDRVRWYADHGFWGIKIYNSMPPAFVKPMAAEAHRLGLHVSGHVPAFMNADKAIRDGYDEINHINQLVLMFVLKPGEDPRTPLRFTVIGERLADLDLQGPEFRKLVQLMKDRKTTLEPTMATFAPLFVGRPGQGSPTDAPWIDHVPAAVQRDRRTLVLDVKPEQYARYDASWKKLEQILVTLHREGVPLVPGTDELAGLVLHGELESWVTAGLTPLDALRAATLGGARFLGRDADLGTIAVGKRAALYLVDGDPLTDIHAIRKGRLVVKDGAFFYPDEIQSALQITPFAKHVEPRNAGVGPPASR